MFGLFGATRLALCGHCTDITMLLCGMPWIPLKSLIKATFLPNVDFIVIGPMIYFVMRKIKDK